MKIVDTKYDFSYNFEKKKKLCLENAILHFK